MTPTGDDLPELRTVGDYGLRLLTRGAFERDGTIDPAVKTAGNKTDGLFIAFHPTDPSLLWSDDNIDVTEALAIKIMETTLGRTH